MDGTILQQGSFTSAGVPVTLQLVGGVDWIKTRNFTKIAAQAVDTGVEFFWQRGSPNQPSGLQIWQAFEYKFNAGATALTVVINDNGFNPLDATTAVPLSPIALTAVSGANPPIVSTASTDEVVAGSIIELVDVNGAQQLGGMYFTIDNVIDNTSFRLPFAPQIVAGGAGFYRVIADDAIFFPRRRFITKLIPGITTQVTLAVAISRPLIPGQFVRLIIPPQYGSISQNLNGLGGNIISIDGATNTLTIGINSLNMGTFSFPLTAAVPFTQAQLIPVGDGADEIATNPQGATENRAAFGIELDVGVDGPAGVIGDVIYWQAGTSFSNITGSRDID